MSKPISFHDDVVVAFQTVAQNTATKFVNLTKDQEGNTRLQAIDQTQIKTDYSAIKSSFSTKVKGSLGDQLEKCEAKDIILLDHLAAIKFGTQGQIDKLSTVWKKFIAIITCSKSSYDHQLTILKNRYNDILGIEEMVKVRRDQLGGEKVVANKSKEESDKEVAKLTNTENKEKLKKLEKERKALDAKIVMVDGKKLERREKKEKRSAFNDKINTLLEDIRKYEKENDRAAFKATNLREVRAKKKELAKLEHRKEKFIQKIAVDGIKKKRKERLEKEVKDLDHRIRKLNKAIED